MLKLSSSANHGCRHRAPSLFKIFGPAPIYSRLTSCKKSEKSLEPFLRKLRYQPTNQPTNANLETFSQISPNKEFFSKIRLWLFYLYSPLTSCKKSEKFLEPFLRKLRYQPTNQPTNYYQQHQFYRSWLTPVQ